MEDGSDAATVPFVLRVTGGRAAPTHTDLPGDEDALPTIVELGGDGQVLARGTKVTEVHSETTDDN